MRLLVLIVTASLAAGPAHGGQEPFNLPVSLPKIKAALEETPLLALSTLDERPTFRVEILERQRIDELLASMDFKTTRAPAGGLYWEEAVRQMWPAVDNPLVQPYAAFGQAELLTVAAEALAGTYFVTEAAKGIRALARTSGEAAAREEVRQAILDFCAAQPEHGAGIQICSTSPATR